MKCDFTFTPLENNRWAVVCERCGLRFTAPQPSASSTCPAIPRLYEIGGWVEIALEAFFLDKRVWVRIKYALGLKPQCGCEKREAWLDAVGKRIHDAVSGVRDRVITAIRGLF